jgi:magnesium transporter
MFGWLRRRRVAGMPDQIAELLPRPLTRLLDSLAGNGRDAPPQPRRHNPDAVVDCAVYQAGGRRPGKPHYRDAARAAHRDRHAFVWLGLHEPDRATMRSVADAFGLHELTVEQTVTGGHRPAVESIGDVTRLVLRTARYVEHEELTADSEVVDTGDVTVLIGPRFVITVRHGAAGALWPVRQELEQRAALLTEGPWAVAHAVCSRMVDLYLDVAGSVERDLERLEEDAFGERAPDVAKIYQLKREMVEFKRAVLPLQEPLARLLDLPDLVPAVLRPYFLDVRGRLARAVDRVAGFDDLLNSILQARLAQVSVDQNNDMRKIASWAAIAAVPTVIGGVYGMNFASIPGLNWRFGFAAAVGAMVVVATFLYWRLKKWGWL